MATSKAKVPAWTRTQAQLSVEIQILASEYCRGVLNGHVAELFKVSGHDCQVKGGASGQFVWDEIAHIRPTANPEAAPVYLHFRTHAGVGGPEDKFSLWCRLTVRARRGPAYSDGDETLLLVVPKQFLCVDLPTEQMIPKGEEAETVAKLKAELTLGLDTVMASDAMAKYLSKIVQAVIEPEDALA